VFKEADMEKGVKDTYGYLGTEPLKLREQLEQLVIALEELAKTEGTDAMSSARDAARRIATHAAAMVENLADKTDEAKAAAVQGRREVEGAIRNQPWAALAIAAATGVLLALLVRR
jgi:ElaB/YqjD/DUF883 family membrane-anchored ribosome-binding protein